MVKCIDMHLSNVLTIICQPKWRNSLTLSQEALLKFNKAAIVNRGLLKNINNVMLQYIYKKNINLKLY